MSVQFLFLTLYRLLNLVSLFIFDHSVLILPSISTKIFNPFQMCVHCIPYIFFLLSTYQTKIEFMNWIFVTIHARRRRRLFIVGSIHSIRLPFRLCAPFIHTYVWNICWRSIDQHFQKICVSNGKKITVLLSMCPLKISSA